MKIIAEIDIKKIAEIDIKKSCFSKLTGRHFYVTEMSSKYFWYFEHLLFMNIDPSG